MNADWSRLLYVFLGFSLLAVMANASPVTQSFNASRDSYVSSLNPTTNYGSATSLWVGNSFFFISVRRETYLAFNSLTVPAGHPVSSASLELYLYDAPSSSRTYHIHRLNGNWNENSITWNNRPDSSNSTSDGSVGSGTTNGAWLSWDVTANVQAFLLGTPNRGWRISQTPSSLFIIDDGLFRSREYSNASLRPQLVVTFENNAPSAPVVDVTPDVANTTDDLTCTITVPSVDPEGDAIVYDYTWLSGTTVIQETNGTASLTDILLSALTAKHETYSCVVTPRDPYDSGPSASDSVTILNSAPVVTVTSPNGGEIWSGVHTIAWTASDADGDALNITLEYSITGHPWLEIVNDTANDGTHNVDTNDSAYGDHDGYWVRATADDDEDTAIDVSDAEMVVDNTAPVTSFVVLNTSVYNDGFCGWYASVVDASLTAVDNLAGVDTIFWNVTDPLGASSAGTFDSGGGFVQTTAEGTNTWRYWANDYANLSNEETQHINFVCVDLNPPAPATNLEGPQWINSSSFTITWDPSAGDGPGSGVRGYYVYVNGTEYYLSGSDNCSFTITWGANNNQYNYYVVATDFVGWNATATPELWTGVDSTKPSKPSLTRTTPQWTNTGIVGLFWTTGDGFSGVNISRVYRNDAVYPNPVPPTTYLTSVYWPTTTYDDLSAKVDGTRYRYQVDAVDNAGNPSLMSNNRYAIYDATAPSSVATVWSGSAGNNSWYVSPVAVQVFSFDAVSGVKRIWYNNGTVGSSVIFAPTGNFAYFIVNAEGDWDTTYYARDRAQNTEGTKHFNIKIDMTPPVAPVLGAPAVVTDGFIPLTWSGASDSHSGVDYYAVYCDGVNVATQPTENYNYGPVLDGNHQCYVDVYDVAGNNAQSNFVDVLADLAPAFISVNSDKARYENGDSITVIAVLNESGLTVTADFSQLDSEYAPGMEAVTADNTTYTITYNISVNNTRPGAFYSFGPGYNVVVTASDAHSTVADSSLFVELDVSDAGSLNSFYSVSGAYDVVSAGVGLRPDPAYKAITLNISGPVVKAFLYWSTYSNDGGNLSINGTAVNGSEIGRFNTTAPNGFWVPRSYRADATALMNGSGDYVVSGDNQYVEGASLVVIYSNDSADNMVVINDGAGNDKRNASTTFNGFTAEGGNSALRMIGGGAKGIGPVIEAFSYFNENLLSNESWNASAGDEWDDDAFNVSAYIFADDATATAKISGDGSKVMNWVVAVLTVKNKPVPPAAQQSSPANQGGGGENSHDILLPPSSYVRVGGGEENVPPAPGEETGEQPGGNEEIVLAEGPGYDIGTNPIRETITAPATGPTAPGGATGLFTAANAPWWFGLLVVLAGLGLFAFRRWRK